MTIMKMFDTDGSLIAKAFGNQEDPITFYVLRGRLERYRELQTSEFAECPVEELDSLPGETSR